MNQLEKKNYIPCIIALAFSVLMFALMAIPHSQYAVMSEMTTLNNPTAFDEAGNAILNWGTVLPAIFTLFQILVLSVIVLASGLALFMDQLYNYRFVMKATIGFSFLSVALQLAYFISGFNGVFDDGTKVIGIGNILVTALDVIYVVALVITYIKYIEKPFKAILASVAPVVKKLDEEERKENEGTTLEERAVRDNKIEMTKMIEDMVSRGELTREQADKMLHELNTK